MSNILTFENTAKLKAGINGVSRPDANGYHQVVLGAFAIHNASGSYYPASVKELFTASSELMNRVNNGRLYGEWGHPKMLPGMSEREYLLKLLTMHEEQISHHIKKLELDESFKSPEGGTCIGVIGWVKPYGPCAEYVEQGLANPDQNMCFSLRSISADKRDASGKLIKNPVKIVTWDGVLEPGIDVADKYHNPAMESRIHKFTETDVIGAYNLIKSDIKSGLESASPAVEQLLRELDINPREVSEQYKKLKTARPQWLNWR